MHFTFDTSTANSNHTMLSWFLGRQSGALVDESAKTHVRVISATKRVSLMVPSFAPRLAMGSVAEQYCRHILTVEGACCGVDSFNKHSGSAPKPHR